MLFGKGLRFIKRWQARVFTCLQYKSFENTVEKGEIARNKQFLLSHSVFYPFGWTFNHFHQIWNCHLQTLSVWKSLKFVVWEWVNYPFPKRQNFDSSKLKEFAGNNLKLNKNSREFSRRVENTAGKGEIACYGQFLLFPQCFQKVCNADM